MTKRNKAVFAKAFKKMEADGCFEELRAKARHKPYTVHSSPRSLPFRYFTMSMSNDEI